MANWVKEKEEIKKSKKVFVKDLIITIIVAVLITVALTNIIRPTIVQQSSMEPTLKQNDYLIVFRLATKLNTIEHGDIIVFKSDLESNDGQKKNLIKRVIGMPGDVITIRSNEVWVNGELLKEDYIASTETPGELYNYIVPVDSYFVMGDNRVVSQDSRVLGSIPKSDIIGEAVVRLYPFSKVGLL